MALPSSSLRCSAAAPSRPSAAALDRAGGFAASVIAVTRKLGLPDEIMKVEGGVIAHGHPVGAAGSILMAGLIHSMPRDGLRRGGQAIVLVLEAIA
jgi:acetyl-CoA acetyltransferase